MVCTNLASTDTTETANWWMKNGGSDAESPNPTTPYNGCTSMMNGSPNSSSGLTGKLTQIPTQDRYGNSMGGTGYTNSYIVESNGNTSSIYNGTALNVSQINRDYHWGLAIWNSVDNAANNIRNDSNLANRAGDTQNMKIKIFTIGYEGNGGTDQGLLLRVANDPNSSSFNVSQQRGQYIPASDSTALANAFAQVASSVLRLSQ